MTVYVDKIFTCTPNGRWRFDRACHMFCDGNSEELHALAARIGLRRSWFQNQHKNPRLHHYDLTVGKRRLALDNGAKEIGDGKQFLELILRAMP